jgi:uncharacterized membrane protein YhaH (DUF805 family)
MCNKEELLKNISEYTPLEIANAIKEGLVTFSELCEKSGEGFTPLLKNQVLAILRDDYEENIRINDETVLDDSIQIKESSNDEEANCPQRMFTCVFSFNGRIGRLEYTITFIAYQIIVRTFNSYMMHNPISFEEAIGVYLTLAVLFWITLAQGAKRCHDVGHSGWFQLVPFYFLWLIFSKGDTKKNKYGSSPCK